jgi:hypothetical protein
MGTYCRNPRTEQERRVNSSHRHLRVEVEVGGETYEIRIRIRGKRSAAILRNAWDDIVKTRQRSWKKFRRTQYKVTDVYLGEVEGGGEVKE